MRNDNSFTETYTNADRMRNDAFRMSMQGFAVTDIKLALPRRGEGLLSIEVTYTPDGDDSIGRARTQDAWVEQKMSALMGAL